MISRPYAGIFVKRNSRILIVLLLWRRVDPNPFTLRKGNENPTGA